MTTRDEATAQVGVFSADDVMHFLAREDTDDLYVQIRRNGGVMSRADLQSFIFAAYGLMLVTARHCPEWAASVADAWTEQRAAEGERSYESHLTSDIDAARSIAAQFPTQRLRRFPATETNNATAEEGASW